MKIKIKEKPIRIPEELPKEELILDPLKFPVELKVREPKGIPIIKAPIELPIVAPNEDTKKKSKSKRK